MEGAQGFTRWVDSQTLDWRQGQAGAKGPSTKTSAHATSMSRQVGFALTSLNLLAMSVMHLMESCCNQLVSSSVARVVA